MKKFLLAGAALGALIIPAAAADLAPYPALPPPPSWTGFYVGGNVGWAGSADAVTVTGTDTGTSGFGTALVSGSVPGIVNLNQTGFAGGGQAGYNWQVSPSWVLGVEADYMAVDAKASNAFTTLASPGILPISTTFGRELNSLGTVRVRFGYLWFPSLLLYGTGGVAYGQNKISSAAVCPDWTPPCTTASQTSNNSVGGTLGAGAEWRFAPAWTLRGEYLYAEFGRHSDTISYNYGTNSSTLTSTVRERDNIVRFAVNYLIGY